MGLIKTGNICILFAVFMAACSCTRVDKTEVVKWHTLPSDDEILDASSGFYMQGRKIYCDASNEWKKTGLWKIYHEDYDDLQAVVTYHDGQRFGLEWHYYNEDVSAVGVNVNDHPFGFGFILDRQMQVFRLGLFSEHFARPVVIDSVDAIAALNENMESILAPLVAFRANDRAVMAPTAQRRGDDFVYLAAARISKDAGAWVAFDVDYNLVAAFSTREDGSGGFSWCEDSGQNALGDRYFSCHIELNSFSIQLSAANAGRSLRITRGGELSSMQGARLAVVGDEVSYAALVRIPKAALRDLPDLVALDYEWIISNKLTQGEGHK